ncbi:MAG: type 1 glutamine amidotransferase [Proteobacteria bacterium]|nr:type 1 glutamine amidotransferase [Pseudomonadota bacterium]
MPKPILIVQNDAHEGAGTFDGLRMARGLDRHLVLGFDTNYEALRATDFSGLVILGGAQSAYETATYPYLSSQMDLCRSFVSTSKPIAGFCLGAQILACALGGSVCPGNRKEIGWFDLDLTEEGENDPLLIGHPKRLMAYHFHGDVIQPSDSFKILARSALTECQMFRYGPHAYGFQYHAEVDEALLHNMLDNNTGYLKDIGVDPQLIVEDARAFLPEFAQHSRIILTRWLGLLPADVTDV